MSPFCGATDTPILDFWWRLVWVSKPEWVLPFLSLAAARGRSRIPLRRGCQPSGRGCQHTFLPNVPQKLHENEKISGRRGGVCWEHPPLDPPLTACMLRYTFPEIHLWCDTCQPLGGQHGSRAVSSTYLKGIGGTQNQELSCRLSVWDQAGQTLYRLSYPS